MIISIRSQFFSRSMKNKSWVYIIFLLFYFSQVQAQIEPDPDITLFENPGFNEVFNAIAESPDGCIFAVGTTTGYVDTEVAGSNPNNGTDAIISKFAPDGTPLWTRQFSVKDLGLFTSTAVANAVATNVAGDAIMVGTATSSSLGAMEAYVARYNSNGELQWVTFFDGQADGNVFPSVQEAFAVAVDAQNRAVFGGGDLQSAFIALIDIETGEIGPVTIVESPTDGPFSFFDPTVISGIAIGPNGGVFATGTTEGDVGDANNPQGGNAGASDTFTARFDSNTLEPDWIRQDGTLNNDVAHAITAFTDTNGDVSIAITGDSDNGFGGDNRTSFGGTDGFVLKYRDEVRDQSGVFQWGEQFGTPFDEQSFGIRSGSNGRIFVTGVTGGILEEGENASPSPDGDDVFLTIIQDVISDGELQDVAQLMAIGNFTSSDIIDIGRSVLVSASNAGDMKVLVAGSTQGEDSTSQDTSDGFIAKFNTFVIGDVNCDGVIDLLDVQPFVDLLVSGEFSAKADINRDGVVDLLDVDPFIALLTG